MKTMIKKEWKQSGKILCIWLSIMLVLCAFCFFEFLSLKDSLGEMAQLMNQLPRLLVLMFGVKADLATPIGWYACLYFWTGILAFAYAMYLGISCVAKEEKTGTAAYLFTKPVDRKSIVLAKVAASLINLVIFAAFTGIFNYTMIILPAGGLDQPGAALTTTIGLFLTQTLFFAVGLLLASWLKGYKSAVRAGSFYVIGAYAVGITAEYSGIGLLDYLTPLRYFDVCEVTFDGLRIFSLLLTLLIVVACVAGAVKKWQRREFL